MLKNPPQNLAAIAESESTNEFKYLDEIAILPELLEIHNKNDAISVNRIKNGVIKLLNGTAELDRKHVDRKTSIYGIKLGKKQRLIVCFLKSADGKNICYVLDFLPFHNYHNSWVFDETTNFWLRLNREIPVITNEAEFEQLVARVNGTLIEETTEDNLKVRNEYLVLQNDKKIFLNDLQKQACSTENAQIIIGFAGTGKTVIAIEKINKYIAKTLKELSEQIYILEEAENPEDSLTYQKTIDEEQKEEDTLAEEKQEIETYLEIAQPKQVFYITKAKILAEATAKQWQSTPLAEKLRKLRFKENNLAPIEVKFGTYEDLHQYIVDKNHELRQQNNPEELQKPEFKYVGYEFFQQWWQDLGFNDHAKRILRSKINNDTYNTLLKRFVKNPDHVYQEFKIIAGHTEADYIALGERQSLFNEHEVRAWLYHKFTAYQEYLANYQNASNTATANTNSRKALKKNTKKRHAAKANPEAQINQIYIDLALTNIRLDAIPPLDLVVVDEGQNTPFVTWQTIAGIAQDNICVCYGPEQITDNGVSPLYFIKQKLNVNEKNIIWMPPDNLRSPHVVNELATRIRTLTSNLIGGSIEKIPEILRNHNKNSLKRDGELVWLKELDDDLKNKLLEESSQSAVLVITFPEFMEEAKKMLGDKAYFVTPDQALGLEHDLVYLINPLNTPEMMRINRVAQELQLANQALTERFNRTDKKDRDNEIFFTALAGLQTSVTRCLSPGKLVIIQPEDNNIKTVLNIIENNINPEITQHETTDYHITTSSEENTENLVRQLQKVGIFKQTESLQPAVTKAEATDQNTSLEESKDNSSVVNPTETPQSPVKKNSKRKNRNAKKAQVEETKEAIETRNEPKVNNKAAANKSSGNQNLFANLSPELALANLSQINALLSSSSAPVASSQIAPEIKDEIDAIFPKSLENVKLKNKLLQKLISPVDNKKLYIYELLKNEDALYEIISIKFREPNILNLFNFYELLIADLPNNQGTTLLDILLVAPIGQRLLTYFLLQLQYSLREHSKALLRQESAALIHTSNNLTNIIISKLLDPVVSYYYENGEMQKRIITPYTNIIQIIMSNKQPIYFPDTTKETNFEFIELIGIYLARANPQLNFNGWLVPNESGKIPFYYLFNLDPDEKHSLTFVNVTLIKSIIKNNFDKLPENWLIQAPNQKFAQANYTFLWFIISERNIFEIFLGYLLDNFKNIPAEYWFKEITIDANTKICPFSQLLTLKHSDPIINLIILSQEHKEYIDEKMLHELLIEYIYYYEERIIKIFTALPHLLEEIAFVNWLTPTSNPVFCESTPLSHITNSNTLKTLLKINPNFKKVLLDDANSSTFLSILQDAGYNDFDELQDVPVRIYEQLQDPNGIKYFYNRFYQNSDNLVKEYEILISPLRDGNFTTLDILLTFKEGHQLIALILFKLNEVIKTTTDEELKIDFQTKLTKIKLDILEKLLDPVGTFVINENILFKRLKSKYNYSTFIVDLLTDNHQNILDRRTDNLLNEHLELLTTETGSYIFQEICTLKSTNESEFDAILNKQDWFTFNIASSKNEFNEIVNTENWIRLTESNSIPINSLFRVAKNTAKSQDVFTPPDSSVNPLLIHLITNNLERLPEQWLSMAPNNKLLSSSNYTVLWFLTADNTLYTQFKNYILEKFNSISPAIWFKQILPFTTKYKIYSQRVLHNLLINENTEEIIDLILNNNYCKKLINPGLFKDYFPQAVKNNSRLILKIFGICPYLLEQIPFAYWIKAYSEASAMDYMLSDMDKFKELLSINPFFKNVILNEENIEIFNSILKQHNINNDGNNFISSLLDEFVPEAEEKSHESSFSCNL